MVTSPCRRMAVGFHHAGFPGAFDVLHLMADNVAEHEGLWPEVLPRRIGPRHFEDAGEPRRDRNDTPGLGLRCLGTDGHLSPIEVDISPRQTQEFAAAAPSLERGDDEPLQVRTGVFE